MGQVTVGDGITKCHVAMTEMQVSLGEANYRMYGAATAIAR